LKSDTSFHFSHFISKGKYIPVKYHVFIILLLILIGLIVRLHFFSGFVLGDDPTYAQYVSQIIKWEYPEVDEFAVFACRPLLLFFTAIPVYLFGWQEWSFVLPILIASLLNIVIIYLSGNRLHSPLAGILGALAYLMFPLDAVNASTYSNDILLSTFVWGGGLLLLFSYKKFHQKKYLFFTFLSGFIVGAAVGIKLNALVAVVLFSGVLAITLWKQLKKGGYKTFIAWGVGWLAINILLCLFFLYLCGDFLAHYHIEKRFNITHKPSGFIPETSSLKSFLLVYPKLMLGTGKEGHSGYFFLSYGYFFLFFLCCLPLAFSKRFKASRLPIALSLFYLFVMEFAPLQLFPHYIPIHRLPRFLHIASMPAALAIGITFAVLVRFRSKVIKISSWLIFLFLIISSAYWAWAKAYFYQDCAQDRRWTWDTIKYSSGKGIIIDPEMMSYLEFRSGYQPVIPIRFSEQMPRAFSKATIIILDGARRPDLYPGYAEAWRKGTYPEDKYIIAQARFPLKSWRLSNVKIYYLPPNISNAYHHTPIEDMVKIGELDIGNPDSEREFDYSIESQTWQGSREFSYPEGIFCEDDGRAFRAKEEFTLNQLFPHRPLIILKRYDPAVRDQDVKVYFNGTYIGNWKFEETTPHGKWKESTFTIPLDLIEHSKAHLSFFYLNSAFDINSFYYWFYQPKISSQ
jgi:4-amino-4-deoxy-L-arabinose transferase-like glycosyltransferase